jgi:hypothetical protein
MNFKVKIPKVSHRKVRTYPHFVRLVSGPTRYHFLHGVGAAFKLFGDTNPRKYYLRGPNADIEALRSDYQAVLGDLENAMKSFEMGNQKELGDKRPYSEQKAVSCSK